MNSNDDYQKVMFEEFIKELYDVEATAFAHGDVIFNRERFEAGVSFWETAAWYQGYNFLRKTEALTTPQAELSARESFARAEALCGIINNVGFSGPFSSAVEAVISLARRKISDIVGEPTYNDLRSAGKFGPGATTSISGRTDLYTKWAEFRPPVTNSCKPLASFIWSESCVDGYLGGPASPFFAEADGDTIGFVPKTKRTHRSISVGPSGNVFCQMAFGKYLERRMKQHGFGDLSRLPEHHTELSRYASRFRTYATLDLSMASDTISRAVVELMFPQRAHSIMAAMRSHYYTLDDKRQFYEKFAGMGNGFIFPLQTILFRALAEACRTHLGVRGVTSCFGDDIIVPEPCVALLTETLTSLGFILNNEKSFSGDTPFRESCGAHFFNGVSIKPAKLTLESYRDFGPWTVCAFRRNLLANPTWRELLERKSRTRAFHDVCNRHAASLARYYDLPLPVVPMSFPETSGWHSSECRPQDGSSVRVYRYDSRRYNVPSSWQYGVRLCGLSPFNGDIPPVDGTSAFRGRGDWVVSQSVWWDWMAG